VTTKRAERWGARISAVEPVLKAALDEDPPPTLEEVTRRVGQLSIATLRCSFPTYWRQLAARRAEHRLRTKEEKIRSILLTGLEESPPPSFETLALRVTLTSRNTLKQHFRQLLEKGTLQNIR
jgi:hypothetical protein